MKRAMTVVALAFYGLLISVSVQAQDSSSARLGAYARGQAAFHQNRISDAFGLLAAAVREAPNDANRRAWYGEAALRMGRYAIARDQARAALSLSSCSSFAHQ